MSKNDRYINKYILLVKLKTMDIAYADTNVYIDWFEWRKGRGFMTHQGEESLEFFNKIQAGKYILLTSDHLDTQLNIHLKDYSQYTSYIQELNVKGFHRHILVEQKDKDQAAVEMTTQKITYEDAVHGVLAIRGNARYLVTQNEPHFRGFRDRIQVSRPRLVGIVG